MGSAWAHQIVNAAHTDGISRVFVVQMEKAAYVEQLALQTKVARFHADPVGSVSELAAGLAKHFPPTPASEPAAGAADQTGEAAFLDALTTSVTVDVDALQRFRGELRIEIAAAYPAVLSSWEFLERAGLCGEGRLTRTGVLMFGKSPTVVCPTAMVKCVRYYGVDRGARRVIETYEGNTPEQIVAAREFVARHTRRDEGPSSQGAQSVIEHGYPMIAVREVIANALVHRDYSVRDACVHVRLFEDRLEISSPGRWLGHEFPTEEPCGLAQLEGQSRKRNFRLAHALSWVRLVEGEGSGIPSALRDCRQTDSPTPTVSQQQGFITVTLRPRPDIPRAHRDGRTIVPRTLPPALARFVGREAELAELENALEFRPNEGGPLVNVITGMAGVGKTALAVHFAHLAANRFPDGQLYMDLGGHRLASEPVLPSDALGRFLGALGVPLNAIPVELTERTALYRSLLAERAVLIVLDNAESSEQVTPLLPGSPHSAVVIASRHRLSALTVGVGAHTLSLGNLSATEALTMLSSRLGEQRLADAPETAAELVDLCARLPLALAVVAARAAARPHLPLHALVAELSDQHHRLDTLDAGGDTSVRAAFSWTYRALAALPARMFRLLGLVPGPDLSLAAAAALCDLPVPEARRHLHALCMVQLVEEHQPDRYRCHDLLHMYAHEQSVTEDSADQRHAVMRRLLKHYRDHSIAANLHISPPRGSLDHENAPGGQTFDSYTAAIEWLTAERPVLLAIVQQIAEESSDELAEHAWQIARALTPSLDLHGLWSDMGTLQIHAVTLAEHTGDLHAQAVSHNSLGSAHHQLGRVSQALEHYQRSLDLCRQIGDRLGEAESLLSLSEIQAQRDRADDASECARHALELFRIVGSRHGEARALSALAVAEMRAGRYLLALDGLRQVRALNRESGDRLNESMTVQRMGQVYLRLAQFQEALACFEQSLDLSRRTGNRHGEAVALNGLGDTYQALGDNQQVWAAWESALNLLTEFGDPDSDALRTKLAALDVSAREFVSTPRVTPSTIMVLDAAEMSLQTESQRTQLRSGLHDILNQACVAAGIDLDACLMEELGDGLLIVAPPQMPLKLFVDPLPRALTALLGEHNRVRTPHSHLRIRAILHIGEVVRGTNGVVGPSVNFALRLVDGVALRSTLKDSESPLVFGVSPQVRDSIARLEGTDDSAVYKQEQTSIKEATVSTWIRTDISIPGGA
ncbi:tetratricopeptide repeat protein [Streptomyces sp. NPDC050535]|uniref:tetratricopeptide repeat protein n=1 Tax=Streptomyces sp. NPDC050535 TaxID=3365626 RepID=UPI0037A00057